VKGRKGNERIEESLVDFTMLKIEAGGFGVFKRTKVLLFIVLLYGLVTLPDSVYADNENFTTLRNIKMTVGFEFEYGKTIRVKLMDFTNGERQTEFYTYPKPVEQMTDGETVEVKLGSVSKEPRLNITGKSGAAYTYKDSSGDILAFNAHTAGVSEDSYILLFNYTDKTLTKVKTYKEASVQLDKNYTYLVFGRKYVENNGVYSIFTKQKLGKDYPAKRAPTYWNNYSLSVTPHDYIVPLDSGNESFVKIRPDGTAVSMKNLSNNKTVAVPVANEKGDLGFGKGSFSVKVADGIKIEGTIGGYKQNKKTKIYEKAQDYFYRVEGKARNLLNKNNVVDSNIILSQDNKYAFIIESYPSTNIQWKQGNPEKVIFSFYDLMNNKLIKSFQAPARLRLNLENTQWYSNTLARFTFASSTPQPKDIFYLDLATGLLTYEGREQSDYYFYPQDYTSNQSYITADTSKLITMQDPYYVTIDGDYVKYSGQGAFEYNGLVYIPVKDFCRAAGIEIAEQSNKWILGKNSRTATIDLKNSRVIQAKGEVFVPAIDIVEKLGFKDKPGSYAADLDLISIP